MAVLGRARCLRHRRSLSRCPESALVAELVPGGARGRAYGLYHFTVGLCALPASLVFGELWEGYGSSFAFATGAALAAAAAAVLWWALAGRSSEN